MTGRWVNCVFFFPEVDRHRSRNWNKWIWMKACQPTPMKAADWVVTSDSRFDVASHTLSFSRVGVFRRRNWTTDRLKLADLYGATLWEYTGRYGKAESAKENILSTEPVIPPRDWARKTSCSEQFRKGGYSKDILCIFSILYLSDAWWSYEVT